MTNTYEIKTEHFSGPLEKLLELIESQKMNITSVNLASVTADFLEYLNHIQTLKPDNTTNIDKITLNRLISDFIVIASKLLLLKSKTLLPQIELTPEEEEEIFDLESRLRIYKEIKTAGVDFKSIWDNEKRSFARDLFQNKPPIFYPPTELKPTTLAKIASQLASIERNHIPKGEMPKQTIISLSSKIQELIERINQTPSFSFKGYSKEKERREVVALFLAILHLIRDKLIDIEQSSTFGDVIIKKNNI